MISTHFPKLVPWLVTPSPTVWVIWKRVACMSMTCASFTKIYLWFQNLKTVLENRNPTHFKSKTYNSMLWNVLIYVCIFVYLSFWFTHSINLSLIFVISDCSWFVCWWIPQFQDEAPRKLKRFKVCKFSGMVHSKTLGRTEPNGSLRMSSGFKEQVFVSSKLRPARPSTSIRRGTAPIEVTCLHNNAPGCCKNCSYFDNLPTVIFLFSFFSFFLPFSFQTYLCICYTCFFFCYNIVVND